MKIHTKTSLLLLSLVLSASSLVADPAHPPVGLPILPPPPVVEPPQASECCNVQLPTQLFSVLNKENSGQSFTISSHRGIVVHLADNSGSTGFAWTLSNSAENVLQLIANGDFIPANSMPGSPNIENWFFKPMAAGQTTLTFSKQRAGDTNAPVETATFTINVQGPIGAPVPPTPSAPTQLD